MSEIESNTQHCESILLVCEPGVSPRIVSNLFENPRFPVTIVDGDLSSAELNSYGSIVYVAGTEDSLNSLLGERQESLEHEEWVLISAEENDVYCTIELSPLASRSLQIFVRSIWSQFSIT